MRWFLFLLIFSSCFAVVPAGAAEMLCRPVLGEEGDVVQVAICETPPHGQELLRIKVAAGWKISYSLCETGELGECYANGEIAGPKQEEMVKGSHMEQLRIQVLSSPQKK